MDALLLPPSPDPQKSITDLVDLRAHHHHPENSRDETMRKKMKPSPTLEKRKIKAKKKDNNEEASSSSCSSSSASNLNSTRRVSRVAHRLRNPSVRLGIARRSVGERQAEALALPLGMSFAAFANLVLERKSAAGQNVYVDDLAGISASAVKESLANVYGDKLGSFATNFEKSFNSTLKILKLINESASSPHQLLENANAAASCCDLDRSTTDGCSDSELSAKETSSATSACEAAIQGSSTMNEIVLHHEETRQQLSRRSSSAMMPLTTFERALEEQARANDLKSMEIGLTMRKLRLKETELSLSYESNNLGKSKLEMNASKAAFRAEKFKTEQEDTRKAEMVNRIMDWLVGSVVTTLAFMLYGVYVFSHQRIKEATSMCKPAEEKTSSSSWWVPKQVSSINTEFNILICRLGVWIQSFFGVLMILVVTYFVIQRSLGATKQTMPITFIVIFLGVICGLPGKICVDTLGGDGKLWLLLWEVFCVLQFVANVFTLSLYRFMYGPVATQGGRCNNTMVPYWARRSVFFGLIVLLPVMNGLLPFATYGEWRHHFGARAVSWWAGSTHVGSDD